MIKSRKKSSFGYLFSFFLGVLLTAGAIYMYHSFTSLPSWYTEQKNSVPDNGTSPNTQPDNQPSSIPEQRTDEQSHLPKNEVQPKLPQTTESHLPKQDNNNILRKDMTVKPKTSLEKKLDEEDFSLFLTQEQANKVLMEQIGQTGGNSFIPKGTLKGAKISITNENVTLSAVINLDEAIKLTGSQKNLAMINQIKRLLPFIDTRQLPLEITGKLRVKGGNLAVDPDARVKVGGLRFRLNTLHNLFLPDETLPESVPIQPVNGIKIDELEILNGGMMIKAKKVS